MRGLMFCVIALNVVEVTLLVLINVVFALRRLNTSSISLTFARFALKPRATRTSVFHRFG